ncbi:hypothetical protein C8F04DRAFT_334143 [Mycena alexandri]|uniref:Uncharacterized protein n=1 Tax=Mycena alexandri TaxID=1745969 RepID=A0AAD6S5R0_9AGAR|nr:hypothetical protein C8F04DRAFT_334143 [Mycena alexandri]
MASDSEASFLRVEVWGMFLEGLAFGIYLVTCGPCFRLFFTTPSHQKRCFKNDWPLVLIFLLFLVETTSSLAIHLYLNLQMVSATTQMQAVTQFRDSRPINRFKYTTILAQSIISAVFS